MQKFLAHYQAHKVDCFLTSRLSTLTILMLLTLNRHTKRQILVWFFMQSMQVNAVQLQLIFTLQTQMCSFFSSTVFQICVRILHLLQERRHSIEPSLFLPIFNTLGPQLAAALPVFHVFTSAGEFAYKGKTTCWKTLQNSPVSAVRALADLGKTEVTSNTLIDALEMFVLKLYDLRTSNKYSRSEVDFYKLFIEPSTSLWCFDNVAKQDLPSPTLENFEVCLCSFWTDIEKKMNRMKIMTFWCRNHVLNNNKKAN